MATTAFPAVQHGFLWLAATGTATMVPSPNTSVATRPRSRSGAPASSSPDAGAMFPPPTPRHSALTPHAGHRARSASRPGGVDDERLRHPSLPRARHRDRERRELELAPAHRAPQPARRRGRRRGVYPDGNSSTNLVPDNSVTTPENLVVADLRTRAATTVYVRGSFEQPARPGSDDATGLTLDWTPDTRYLLLAGGIGRVMAIDPAQPHVVSSRASWGITTTAAVIGASSAGSPRLPPTRPEPADRHRRPDPVRDARAHARRGRRQPGRRGRHHDRSRQQLAG